MLTCISSVYHVILCEKTKRTTYSRDIEQVTILRFGTVGQVQFSRQPLAFPARTSFSFLSLPWASPLGGAARARGREDGWKCQYDALPHGGVRPKTCTRALLGTYQVNVDILAEPALISDMEDCTPGTSTPDFQSILWSASGTPIQFLAIFYYEERMKIQNPFFKKDLERERNPFKKDFPYDWIQQTVLYHRRTSFLDF